MVASGAAEQPWLSSPVRNTEHARPASGCCGEQHAWPPFPFLCRIGCPCGPYGSYVDLWCALLPLALFEVRARALRVHALRAPAAAERSSYGSHGTQGLRLSGAVAAPYSFNLPLAFLFHLRLSMCPPLRLLSAISISDLSLSILHYPCYIR